MNRPLASLGLVLSSLVVFACATSHEEAAQSSEDITGSLGDARACDVVAAYQGAGTSAFEFLERSGVPFSVPTDATTLARFDVPGEGKSTSSKTRTAGTSTP